MSTLMPKPYAWGISMGAMHWSAHAVPFDREQQSKEKGPTGKHIAASVLLARSVGEPHRLDYWSPPHPRGTANPWPPEAAVGRGIGSGRFPIAAAWTGRADDGNELWRWTIDGEDHELSSLDALTVGASQLAKTHAKDAPTAIVIPNDFRQREQQKLLDACSIAGVHASLLWLPVAAALTWLEQHKNVLKPPQSASEDPLALPIVHADWGQVRCSMLQIVPTKAEDGFRWIPARRRPIVSDWHTPGFGWTEAAGCDADNSQMTWRKRFASSVLNLETDYSISESNLLEQIASWSVEQKGRWQVDLALAEHLSSIPSSTSIVFVGDFANQVACGEHVQRQMAANRTRMLVANAVAGENLLAHGAAIFARDRMENRISYLDTLPDLEMFVDRNHQYDWLSLLGDTNQFVPGGEEWNLPRPIEGLALRRGATSIKLVVAHDEYDGVRELQVTLDRPAEQRLSAKLHVSATPAQGNAKLMLVTESQGEIPSRSIHANWDRMQPVLNHEGQSVDKETFLKMQPRAFPELLPRLNSRAKWLAARHSIENVIFAAECLETRGSLPTNVGLHSLKEKLMEKDPDKRPRDATAVGSDHVAPTDQELLQSLTLSVLAIWRFEKPKKSSNLTAAVRCLGYLSVASLEFEEWALKNRTLSLSDPQAVLHSSGLCFRNPKCIAELFKGFVSEPASELKANQLKAMSQILSYRVDATRETLSQLCDLIARKALDVFERHMRNGGGSFTFRWSTVVIVYLLRRRMFDLDFMDPAEENAVRAKELFLEAISLHEMGKLRPIGGAVNLPAALQQMINYIDRKGSGDILMASE